MFLYMSIFVLIKGLDCSDVDCVVVQYAGALHNSGGFHGVQRRSSLAAVTALSRPLQAEPLRSSSTCRRRDHPGLRQVPVPSTLSLLTLSVIDLLSLFMSSYYFYYHLDHYKVINRKVKVHYPTRA